MSGVLQLPNAKQFILNLPVAMTNSDYCSIESDDRDMRSSYPDESEVAALMSADSMGATKSTISYRRNRLLSIFFITLAVLGCTLLISSRNGHQSSAAKSFKTVSDMYTPDLVTPGDIK